MFADNDFLKCTQAHKVLSIKQSTGRLHAVQTERKSPVNGRVHTNNALCDNVATVAGQRYKRTSLAVQGDSGCCWVFFLDSSRFLAGRSWIQLRHGLFPSGGEVGPSARPLETDPEVAAQRALMSPSLLALAPRSSVYLTTMFRFCRHVLPLPARASLSLHTCQTHVSRPSGGSDKDEAWSASRVVCLLSGARMICHFM